jgi:hypothetical protein
LLLGVAITTHVLVASSQRAGVPTNPISREEAISLARQALHESHRSLEAMTVLARLWKTSKNDVMPPKLDSQYQRELREKLTHGDYWIVTFRPNEQVLGGGMSVFIRASDGSILGVLGSR